MSVAYSTMNSGGSFYITIEQFRSLESAGWEVIWADSLDEIVAIRRGLSMEEAVKEWADITGEDPEEVGCECCGRPHLFGKTDE